MPRTAPSSTTFGNGAPNGPIASDAATDSPVTTPVTVRCGPNAGYRAWASVSSHRIARVIRTGRLVWKALGYSARMTDAPDSNEHVAAEGDDEDAEAADVSGGAVPEKLLDEGQGYD